MYDITSAMMVNNIFTLYSWDYPIKLPNGFLYSVEDVLNYFTGGYKGFLNAIVKGTDTNLLPLALNCDQTGWGLTPVIGADVKLGKTEISVLNMSSRPI